MSARALPKTSLQVQPPGTEASLDLSGLSAHIAAELAAGLSDAAAVRQRYGISPEQWDTLKKSPIFRRMLAEAIREFGGDMNAGNRIQKKADIVLEDMIPVLDSIAHDSTIPAQARIDAIKETRALTGRTAKQGEGGAPAGGGFTLNINLGGREKLVIDGKNLPVVNDE